MDEPQQVLSGIFPTSHIFVRDRVLDAEGRLTGLINTLSSPADERTSEGLRRLEQIDEGDGFGPWGGGERCSYPQANQVYPAS